jgi:hypothetical protein
MSHHTFIITHAKHPPHTACIAAEMNHMRAFCKSSCGEEGQQFERWDCVLILIETFQISKN